MNFTVRLFEDFLNCVFFKKWSRPDFCKHSALFVRQCSKALILPAEKSPEKFSGSSRGTRELSELKSRAHFRARKIGAFKRNTWRRLQEIFGGLFGWEKKFSGDFHKTYASFPVAVSFAFRATNQKPWLSLLTSQQDALSAFDRNVVLLSMPAGVLVDVLTGTFLPAPVLHVQVRCIC